MKALSLTQPWATLVAIGAKRYETRSWRTKYRGEIAIHASKGFPKKCVNLCEKWPFLGVLPSSCDAAAEDLLPLGAIIAVATIGGIYPTGSLFSLNSLPDTATHEEEFGDYSPGRFAWELRGVRRLKEPVPCKGALSLWEIPADIEAKVRAQL